MTFLFAGTAWQVLADKGAVLFYSLPGSGNTLGVVKQGTKHSFFFFCACLAILGRVMRYSGRRHVCAVVSQGLALRRHHRALQHRTPTIQPSSPRSIYISAVKTVTVVRICYDFLNAGWFLRQGGTV